MSSLTHTHSVESGRSHADPAEHRPQRRARRREIAGRVASAALDLLLIASVAAGVWWSVAVALGG
jgi:hypothetical protein